MDENIQFGEVEQAAPERALRPDENGAYAVVAYGEPTGRDLPIFIELDVLRDMEAHSQSDTSVELGGVMFGGRYLDERGQRFVVIRESLRAEHHESTKGSFKFTHDSWSAIARQRAKLPADLQMVGWYHTHPGWGVFLSGMDEFICENFFKNQLDVALVIDPCRTDRGMFQWTAEGEKQLRRTSGFFVISSRFRAAELANFIAELSTGMPTTHAPSGQTSAPIIHVHQPSSPPWQAAAFAVALALQVMLLLFIALRLSAPAGTPARSDSEQSMNVQDRNSADLDHSSADLKTQGLGAQTELLDAVVKELKGTDPGFVTRLQERFDHTAKLAEDVAARDALLRELRSQLEDHRRRLADLEATAKGESVRLQTQIANLTAQNEQLKTQVASSSETKSSPATNDTPAAANVFARLSIPSWWWASGAALVAAIALGAFYWSRAPWLLTPGS